MDSPWGNIAVCDAHIHFFSHRFFSTLASQKGVATAAELAPLLGWEVPPPDPLRLAGAWNAELDGKGVERAAIIASIPGDEDSVLAAARAYPDRFYAYAMVNPLAADAPAQLQASLAAGLRAICLFPSMHCYAMHDDRVKPILDIVAAKPGVPVFVHCGALSVGVRQKLGLPSLFDMRFSNPLDLHAIALRYPSIVFVIPHFGAGYFRETLMLCDLCPNVWLDTSSSNRWMRYEEAHLDLRTIFRRSIDVAGLQRLLFGTDSSFFPRGWNQAIFDAQATALYELGLTAEQAALIFGGNLKRLLGSN